MAAFSLRFLPLLSKRLIRRLPIGSREAQCKLLSSGLIENKGKSDGDTFSDLLENSRLLTSCGRSPVGHKVVGEIIAEVDGDLYVDFGGKFHGVVPKPHKDGDRYTKGVKVNIIVNDLEMTHHFLGKSCDTTLLEADIDLIGIKDEQIKTSYTTDTYYEENEISYF